jgi:CheY-like chemotaxis protein
MVLSVRDTGRGIDPAFVPHVFERFRQADGSTTRSSGGLGLGLAIVRHLAEMHGGTVTAASEGLDKGATFTVTLPVKAFSAPVGPASLAASGPAPAAPAALPLQGVLAGTRVLVVEDEEDARELIEILLSGAGAVVKTTSSAEDAMGELADFDPQVLVSDIGMPGRDGYWLVEAVRRRRPGLPTIALTAFSRSEDERRARTAGFDHHLGKPVDPDRLVEIVASYRSGA